MAKFKFVPQQERGNCESIDCLCKNCINADCPDSNCKGLKEDVRKEPNSELTGRNFRFCIPLRLGDCDGQIKIN